MLRSPPHSLLIPFHASIPSLACAFAVTLAVSSASAQGAAEPAAAPTGDPAPAADPAPATAGEPASTAEAAAAPEPAAKPKPPPYSLPFALRPAIAVTVVRSDTALALYENPASGESGSTVASMLLGSYKVTEEFAPMVRVGAVSNAPPSPGESAFHFINPVLGATYAIKPAAPLRLAFFLGVTVPVGGGGGNGSDPEHRVANAAGMAARSYMDNAMFAVNDLTVFPGVSFAYVSGGFTAQVEATVLQLMRVRGDTYNRDSSKTNLTTGIHLGYFLIPMLSVGVELRHQRWLSTPANVTTDALRDNTTFAIGPRFHFKVGEKSWLRPGLSFGMPLDDPMKDASYKIFQLDVPFVF